MECCELSLKDKAREIRKDIMEMVFKGGFGHPGPALSCADIITVLYNGGMNIQPNNPKWEDRDRFILSKGHACPAVYAALAEKGYFDKKLLCTFRKIGSMLQGHPDVQKTPGIDMTSGSLGHGLSIGLGMAIALKLRKSTSKVFVVLGDGEIQEGIVWEAAMSAPKFKVDNLIAIIDYNHFQSGGCTDDTMSIEPVSDKWKSFGWRVFEMDGHNMEDIKNKIEMARTLYGKPTVIIAHTVKGKGISFMENDNSWHQRMPTQEQYDKALIELNER